MRMRYTASARCPMVILLRDRVDGSLIGKPIDFHIRHYESNVSWKVHIFIHFSCRVKSEYADL